MFSSIQSAAGGVAHLFQPAHGTPIAVFDHPAKLRMIHVARGDPRIESINERLRLRA